MLTLIDRLKLTRVPVALLDKKNERDLRKNMKL